jgi:capsular exopolysaccharide synthesis family protein
MSEANETTSLREYLAVLREQKWLILAVTLVAVAIGLAYSILKEPTYTATATVEFNNPDQDVSRLTPGAQILPVINETAAAAAASRTVTRDDVVKAVLSEVPNGGYDDADDLRADVEATVQQDSNLVAIEASTDDAEVSAQIANEFANQTRIAERKDIRADYAAKVKELSKASEEKGIDPTTAVAYQTAIGRASTLSKVADPVDVTRPATVPESASSPKPVRDTVLAGILGLLLGIGAAYLRHALDRRIRDSHEIQRRLNLPLVGYVRSDALGMAGLGGKAKAKSKGKKGEAFVSEDDLEAFRILRTNVGFLGDEDLSSVVVTSALPGEGKSTVAAWYAYVNAVAGRRTLLVEADFRRPVLAKRFGVDTAPGLSDYLADGLKPRDVIRTVDVQGREAVDVLPLIPAGDNVYQPTEMIASKKFKDFVEEVTDAYDLVVFDSAPLLPVGDTLELVPLVESVLFCVRVGQTTRDQAEAAKQALDHLAEKPTGLVVTGVERGGEDDYYGYYSSYRGRTPAKS